MERYHAASVLSLTARHPARAERLDFKIYFRPRRRPRTHKRIIGRMSALGANRTRGMTGMTRGHRLDGSSAYFRFAMAVRSNLPVAAKVALHQVEPNPPGLMPVKSPENLAVWSLVKALQSPLL